MGMKFNLILAILLVGCIILIIYSSSTIVSVDVKKSPKYVVSEKFLSVALDTSLLAKHFRHFNMTNTRLKALVSYFSPAYLRIGGNMADRLIFSPNGTGKNINLIDGFIDSGEYDYDYGNPELYMYKLKNFIMTGEEWITINNFAEQVGLSIIFDINCLIRNEDGSWNTENAEELLLFSNKHDFQIDWQLGNEPDAFKHMFNVTVSAAQLARDFSTLKSMLNKYPKYKSSKLIGPDTTRPRSNSNKSVKYLRQFLENVKHDLDAVTWHQYYFSAQTATVSDFIDPGTMDLLEQQIQTVQGVVEESGLSSTPIWLGETGSAYGGGARALSDRFAASFLWLDKLGLAARHGLQTVIRQSLFEGYYSLIDAEYNPTPDWWISMAYKMFVGPQVLDCEVPTKSTVRLYCHCAQPSEGSMNKSAVVVFGINIGPTNETIEIKMDFGVDRIAYAYVFTADGGSLTTKNVLLNGDLLSLTPDNNLPVFRPVILNLPYQSANSVDMPLYSLAFWVIPSNAIEVCTYF